MRVLVCGGRDFDDSDFIWNTLTELDARRGPFTCVIHGAYRGVDTQAMIWAQMMDSIPDRSVKHAPFLAEWGKYGRSAGPIRNQRMLDEGKPDLVIAFPGNSGTADMISRAEYAGVEVLKIEYRK